MRDVAIHERGGARVLEISRPERANAMRRQTVRELGDALADAAEGTRGIVICGAGGRFSAGADLDELRATEGDIGFDDELEALTGAIVNSSLPVVAAVEGDCVGGGVDLAWACDAVVVSRVARVLLPPVQLGILYNPAALARLHARLGSALVRRLVVLGEELSGAEVAASGAAIAVDAGNAVATTIRLLDGAGGSPEARGVTKSLLAALDAGDFAPADWQEQRRALLASPQRRRLLAERIAWVGGRGC